MVPFPPSPLPNDGRSTPWQVRVLIGLYALFVIALLLVGLSSSTGFLLLIAGLLVAQIVFVFSTGTRDLVRPVRKARLLAPIVIFAAMLLLLTAGIYVAVDELLMPNVDGRVKEVTKTPVLVLLGAQWVFWVVVVWVYATKWPRLTFLARAVQLLLAGSLLELLVTVPAHLITSRRPGCFAGLGTMLGIFAGVLVIVFACGPGIAWLMLWTAMTAPDRDELRRVRLEARRAEDSAA